MFIALSTQWRTAGMGTPAGLDYGAIIPALRLIGIPKRTWSDVFDDLRVMERAALEVFAKNG